MANFRIEKDESGKFVLINDDTGGRQPFATQKEAEAAKASQTKEAAVTDKSHQSQVGVPDSGTPYVRRQRPDPDHDNR